MVSEIIGSFWHFLGEAAPWLLLGFLFAGLLKVFIPSEVILRYIGGGNIRSILTATLVGIPLPLCSCGVLPTAMTLYKQGSSKAATMAFLIATPATTVTAIVLTLAMLGWKFTMVYVVTAFVVATGTGLLALLFLKTKPHEVALNSGETKNEDACGCGCEEEASNKTHHFREKLRTVFHYGFIEMMEDIGLWILIGLLLAAVIYSLLPGNVVEEYMGSGLLALVLVAVVSAPMYICSTAAVPFVAAMMATGMLPGAGLVILILGPATNVSTILVIARSMGKSTAVLYIASIMVISIGTAYVVSLGGWL